MSCRELEAGQLWLCPYRSRGQLSGDGLIKVPSMRFSSQGERHPDRPGTLPSLPSEAALIPHPLRSKGHPRKKHENIHEGRLHELSSKKHRDGALHQPPWTMWASSQVLSSYSSLEAATESQSGQGVSSQPLQALGW